jgi:AAA family ATP:ADP antiporter
LLQLFAVSRILKYAGVGGALLIHPIVVLIGYLVMLKTPSVPTMQWLKVFDNGIDYSLGNTARHSLWLPTSRVAKYKAKQAVDAFFMRAGDVLQAGIVFVGERLAFTVPMFAGLNIVLTLGWITIVTFLNSAYRMKAATAPSPDASVTASGAADSTPEAA